MYLLIRSHLATLPWRSGSGRWDRDLDGVQCRWICVPDGHLHVCLMHRGMAGQCSHGQWLSPPQSLSTQTGWGSGWWGRQPWGRGRGHSGDPEAPWPRPCRSHWQPHVYPALSPGHGARCPPTVWQCWRGGPGWGQVTGKVWGDSLCHHWERGIVAIDNLIDKTLRGHYLKINQWFGLCWDD